MRRAPHSPAWTCGKNRHNRHHNPRQHQRGVASLIIVMVLFFILSMVAAYTNRNLIFEQRTSANQYRSTQAIEAAEAGLEWATALLNSGRIDAVCAASADITDTTFRQRYLAIDAASGVVTRLTQAGGAELQPTCVRDGNAWRCSCPADGAPVLDPPAVVGVFPAFRVRFLAVSTTQPGIVRIEATGCTRLDDTCLVFPARAAAGDAGTTLSVLVALQSGVAMPPVAALTVRGNLNVGGAALGAFNEDPASAITLRAGGNVSRPGLVLGSAAGTPVEQSYIANDSELADVNFNANRMFAAVFGMWPSTYPEQPAAVVLACPLGGCTAAIVRDAATANPGRVLWAPGDLVFDSAGDVGSAAEPVVVVATGSIRFTDPSVTVYGLLYSRAGPWTTAGGGTVVGAAVAENDLVGSGTTAFVYNATVLETLRLQTGSFVRVPGSWKDFP